MKQYESILKARLLADDPTTDWHALLGDHERTIAAMQHERLVHLLVTLAFGAFLLISIGIALLHPALLIYVLSGLFFLLLVFYVAHYFFLENTVQRWYELTDEIVKRSGERN